MHEAQAVLLGALQQFQDQQMVRRRGKFPTVAADELHYSLAPISVRAQPPAGSGPGRGVGPYSGASGHAEHEVKS